MLFFNWKCVTLIPAPVYVMKASPFKHYFERISVLILGISFLLVRDEGHTFHVTCKKSNLTYKVGPQSLSTIREWVHRPQFFNGYQCGYRVRAFALKSTSAQQVSPELAGAQVKNPEFNTRIKCEKWNGFSWNGLTIFAYSVNCFLPTLAVFQLLRNVLFVHMFDISCCWEGPSWKHQPWRLRHEQ